MKIEKQKFDLIENAKDSLSHAVEHLTKKEKLTASDLKRAILDVTHVVELILKERLRRIHPAFIWEHVDKYPSSTAQKVGTEKAITRLLNIEGIALSDDSKKTLAICRRIRNSIEHYEFEIELKKTKVIVGRMLSFIFLFSKSHLNLDMEADFTRDDRCNALLAIYEFWEAHSIAVKNQLLKEGADVCECPACGAFTYNLSETECALCGHMEEQVQCEHCKEIFWESETETFEELEGDEESGIIGGDRYTICKNCMEELAAEDVALEVLADSLREK